MGGNLQFSEEMIAEYPVWFIDGITMLHETKKELDSKKQNEKEEAKVMFNDAKQKWDDAMRKRG